MNSTLSNEILCKNNSTSMNFNDSLIKIHSLIKIIENIYLSKNYEINFQLIYCKCYEICQNRMVNELYSHIVKLLEMIIDSYFEIINTIPLDEEYDILNNISNNFFIFNSKSKAVADSLLYLDRVIKKYNNEEMSIYEMSMYKYLFRIISVTNTKDKFLNLFDQELLQIRNGKNNKLLQFEKFINLFSFFKNFKIKNQNLEDNFYNLEFIPILLSHTENFYSKYSYDLKLNYNECDDEVCITNNNDFQKCVNLIKNIYQIIDVEENLWKFLPEEKDKIIITILDILLIKNSDFIFSSTMIKCLTNSDFESLSLIYKIFFYIKSNNYFQNKFYQKFQENVMKMLKDLASNFVKFSNYKNEYFNFYQYVEEIYELKKKITASLINSLENNSKIEQIIKSSFEKLINKHEEFIEHFIILLHEEIKISIKNKNNKVKEFNDKFITIFKLINDKDIFEYQYRKYLSKRLLRNSSMLQETEFDFFSIMKKESGLNYVKKMENMINDIFFSKDINIEFQLYNKKKYKIDFYVKILSTENWLLDVSSNSNNIINDQDKNSFTTNSVSLPPILDNYIIEFSNFYNSKYKNRFLIWEHKLSWAEVNASFNKKYLLIVSSYQMTILNLFNTRSRFTITEILKVFDINPNDKNLIEAFMIHLSHLIKSGLFFILNCSDINNLSIDNIICLNNHFNSKEYKLILNNFKKKEVQKETVQVKEISHFLIEDRKHQIDAAIMKLLKQNKKLNFENLKIQLIDIVKPYFIPDLSLIKLRIDNLIDRELIIRDKNDSNIILYIN